ncbi:conserved hypothetical protein [Theileria equi strain WA]|uniref:Uncharacterized protein n=1 Tax=Theileria equi strain WA TaxID=1537102 RepID=L1LG84_THEEQ|nr:conserved hypothetical protein [Theileria equi strain WA]EKX74371.1 conserved hypothetical protein [Theileria equi strain WA]|eukprot:XP_004833823.1 conserved hypothetical protein [Theileria equi strain WA]
MDEKWKDTSNKDESVPTAGFESLSLGQKLLSKCVKRTGISVSVRGIAINTTSQIKTAGSAWKSEGRYDYNRDGRNSSFDVSFPDLLGSSNNVNKTPSQWNSDAISGSETATISNSETGSRNGFKNYGYSRASSRDNSSSRSFRNFPPNGKSTSGLDNDILGDQFLMPGMKGTYPLGFTNFIGKGVESSPPPPPETPFNPSKVSLMKPNRLKSRSNLTSPASAAPVDPQLPPKEISSQKVVPEARDELHASPSAKVGEPNRNSQVNIPTKSEEPLNSPVKSAPSNSQNNEVKDISKSRNKKDTKFVNRQKHDPGRGNKENARNPKTEQAKDDTWRSSTKETNDSIPKGPVEPKQILRPHDNLIHNFNKITQQSESKSMNNAAHDQKADKARGSFKNNWWRHAKKSNNTGGGGGNN